MNFYRRWLGLIPQQPLDAGEVIAVHDDGVTVQLPTGVQVRVRGEAEIGEHVYIRAGAVEGPAPALEGIDQDV
jgi:hypothetical protein